MATEPLLGETGTLKLELAGAFPGMRALAWDRDVLYASRGYELYSAETFNHEIKWRLVASYRPQWWRNVTSQTTLSFRLVRDGFHALAVLPQGNLVVAVPDRKSTRLNSSHRCISYAVFC